MTFKDAISDKTTISIGLACMIFGTLIGLASTSYAIGMGYGAIAQRVTDLDIGVRRQIDINQTIATAVSSLTERSVSHSRSVASHEVAIESIRKDINTLNQRVARIEGRGVGHDNISN